MEKATLLVRETTKKKIVAEFYFPALDKKMPFPQISLKDTSLNGTEVEVERIAGRIVKVQAGKNILYLNIGGAKTTHGTAVSDARKETQKPEEMQIDHVEHIRYAAHAPYNFVPLNTKVVEAKDPVPDFDKYHNDTGRHTGWIEIEIETKTPLYIRGTLTEKQVKAGKECKDISAFFASGGKLSIPGSSLRGMLRALVEIVSFGKFGDYDDRLLYYRGLADKCKNFRDEYQQKMSSYDRRTRQSVYKMSAGVLRRSGEKNNNDERMSEYEIVPSDKRQILKHEARVRVRELGKRYDTFNFYKLDGEYLVVSGDMPNKKRDWLIDFPKSGAKPISIPLEDVYNYKNDATRAKEAPNLSELVDRGQEVPCFYVKWKDSLGHNRVSFGHTGMFRLAYEKTIGEHIPLPDYKITEKTLTELQKKNVSDSTLEKLKSLLNCELTKIKFFGEIEKLCISPQERELIMAYARLVDFAEAIFGNEKTFAGRVFFENALVRLEEGQTQKDVLMGEGTPKILSSPKPTTFQHYLVQSSDKNKELSHYNSNTAIRGNKLYWHKSGEDWEEIDREAIQKHKTQYTIINPVKPGTKFTGRIRFENLSNEELGALLFVLDLPEGCSHKLGMGKPLGLGSIQITPIVYLSNREKRYKELFHEWDNKIPESEDIQKKKEAFEDYVKDKLEHNSSLWKTERLQELEIMLNYKKGLERQMENLYMDLKAFRNRPVLPKPSKV